MSQTTRHAADLLEYETAEGITWLHAEADRLGITVEHLAEIVISESLDVLIDVIANVEQARLVASFEVSQAS